MRTQILYVINLLKIFSYTQKINTIRMIKYYIDRKTFPYIMKAYIRDISSAAGSEARKSAKGAAVETIGIISRLTIDFIFSGMECFPEKGGEVHCSNFVHTLGGGPVVSAVRLHAMGCPVKFGTYLGRTWESEEARRLLSAYDLPAIRNLYSGEGQPITISSVISMPGERSITSYEEPLRLPGPHMLEAFFKDCSIVVAPHDIDSARALKKSGKLLVYDTNDFDMDLSPEFVEQLDIITPNAREAAALTKTSSIDAALEKFCEMGVRHPIVKNGASGCRTLLQGRFINVPPPRRFHSVDTTGAGDNFLAGLLYGCQRNWDILDCMAMANIWGELSTTAVGALGAAFTEAETLDIFRQTADRG